MPRRPRCPLPRRTPCPPRPVSGALLIAGLALRWAIERPLAKPAGDEVRLLTRCGVRHPGQVPSLPCRALGGNFRLLLVTVRSARILLATAPLRHVTILRSAHQEAGHPVPDADRPGACPTPPGSAVHRGQDHAAARSVPPSFAAAVRGFLASRRSAGWAPPARPARAPVRLSAPAARAPHSGRGNCPDNAQITESLPPRAAPGDHVRSWELDIAYQEWPVACRPGGRSLPPHSRPPRAMSRLSSIRCSRQFRRPASRRAVALAPVR